MKKDPFKIEEYIKYYDNISFIVHYSYNNRDLKKMFFAAQPTETYDGVAYDFLYGQIDSQMHLQIGFKQFQIPMTEEFHNRLGILYKKIRNEYVDLNNRHL